MSALPYPHARNDCAACRERDADLTIRYEVRPGMEAGTAVCARCAGGVLVALAARAPVRVWTHVEYESGDEE